MNPFFDDEEEEEEEEEDYEDIESIKERIKRGIKPPKPPVPPKAPHILPLPPIHQQMRSTSDLRKVIGIRGLDRELYKRVSIKAKELGLNVSDLINDILYQYLEGDLKTNQVIGGLDSLEIYDAELEQLGDSTIIFSDISELSFGPNISSEAFTKVSQVRRVEKVVVPSNLYFSLLQKVRHCGRIEKYSGNTIPHIIRKAFSSDASLSREFFEYFIEDGSKIDLIVHGDLEIDEDVTVEHLKKVFRALRVSGDILIPRAAQGWIYAIAECHGEISTYD